MGRLGYSSITLTDLTETLPVSLTLETNLDKNIQVKTGNLYVPNFNEKLNPEEEFEGVIITPSLFLGNEDLKIENNSFFVVPDGRDSGFIYYEIGSVKYSYVEDISSGIYVDKKGRLHIEENLSSDITIEAYIEDFENVEHGYTIDLVTAINPISILLLEEGTSNYRAVIECQDGREHFEDTNANAIVMTALLYQGSNILNEDKENTRYSYAWERLSDGDIDIDSINQTLSVTRAEVVNRDFFTCVITDNETGLSYTASQFLYDFTDTYACDISYNKMPLLTDKDTSIELTAIVWNKGEPIKEDTEGFDLSYSWFARGINSETEITLAEDKKEPKLDLNINNIPALQSQDFVVYCKVFQTDSAGTTYHIAGGSTIIHYTIQYNIRITPQNIFVPTSNAGKYQGEESKQYNFVFEILGASGNPLLYNEKDAMPQGNNNDEKDLTNITFTQKIEEEKKFWSFSAIVTLDTEGENSLWQSNSISKMYGFSFTYLDQVFTEQINIVKNIAGEQGFSGYTIDLSNEFHAFSGGEGQADSDQFTSCSVSAYFGSDKKEIKKISINNDLIIYENNQGYKENIEYNFGKNNSSLFFSTSPGNEGSININIRTNNSEIENEKSSFLRDIEPISFYITIKDDNVLEGEEKEITFFKTFTYTINYQGKSYFLNINPTNIRYSEASGKYDPSSIEVSALARGENGEASLYESGKIIYSFDGKVWSYLGNTGSITGYKWLEKIEIRLYSGQASISKGNINLDDNKKYLLDIETIPILTSLDGYEIGGENLLRLSKTFLTGDSKWKYFPENSSLISRQEEGDVYALKYSKASDEETTTTYYAQSPSIVLKEEFLNKTFCFSCFIYSEETENNNLDFYLNFDTSKQKIATINLGNGSGDIVFKDDWGIGKWFRIYKTFLIGEEFFIKDNFSILFSSNGKSLFKIKQPKLEIGNIPTSWTSATNDVIFENLVDDQDLMTAINNILGKADGNTKIIASIIEPFEGKTVFNTIEELRTYFNNEIGVVKKSVNSGLEYVEGELNTRMTDVVTTDENGDIILKDSRISSGYLTDDKTPFLSLSVNSVKNSSRMMLTNEELGFYENENKVAYIGKSTLSITQGRFTEQLSIGKNDTGYLLFKPTNTGIALVWSDTIFED